MERRELLLGLGAIAATVVAEQAVADDDHGMAMDHAMAGHEHHHMGGVINAALLGAASDCVKAGRVCTDHCLQLFASGDNSTAACARSVNELVPVCEALAQLAASNSKYLARYARVAMDICKGCEDECRKHEKEHSACKNCADACAACAKECEKVAA
jgi:Cys-rich four helix bundle protein (predicted Tat secretion target)